VLAGELERTDDPADALAAYEAAMRPVVEEDQGVPGIGPRIMHPRSRLGIRLPHGALDLASRPLIRGLPSRLFAREPRSPGLSRYPRVGDLPPDERATAPPAPGRPRDRPAASDAGRDETGT